MSKNSDNNNIFQEQVEIQQSHVVFSNDFINFIKQIENTQKTGFQNGKWYPHNSVEGGLPTIGYGHKISTENELKILKKGITENEINRLLIQDLQLANKKVDEYIKRKYKVNLILSQVQREILVEYAFNLGSLDKFPKFVDAVLRKRWDIAEKEYKRFSKGKELRNKQVFDRYSKAKLNENKSQINTARFKKWFQGSKAVDKNGNPLIVYHGTKSEFSKFCKRRSGGLQNRLPKFWFTSDSETANMYALDRVDDDGSPSVMPLYVSIKNPIPWEEYLSTPDDIIKQRGYDGMLHVSEQGEISGAVFNPNQLKSAISNNGNFDPNDDDILKENVMTHIKQLILEGVKEKAIENFIQSIIKGTQWEGKVFIAGGYVRDELRGDDPKDMDLLVNSPNGGIEFAIWITKKVGAYKEGSNPVIASSYGTAAFQLRGVVHNGIDLSDYTIEAVMPRKEKYEDPNSRNPSVSQGTLPDDVERRDFTINSLLKNLSTGEILDLTGMGKDDIKKGIVRTKIDPDQIFKDDPLRMLRAVRFAVKYNWQLPMFMIRAIKKNAARLEIISKERVRDELNKILVTKHPSKGIKMIKMVGLIPYVIPELIPAIKMIQNVYHKHDVFTHTLEVLSKTQPILVRRLMALFHDIGKTTTRSVTPTGVHFYGHEDEGAKIAEKVMRDLKYPNEIISAVVAGVKNHMKLKGAGDDAANVNDKTLRKFRAEMGEQLENILDVIHADNISHSEAASMPNQIEAIKNRLNKLEAAKPKPQLPINGNDLIEMGIKPGPIFSKILGAITDAWYENPNISKEEAFEIVKSIKTIKESTEEEYQHWIKSDEYKKWRQGWLDRHNANLDEKGRLLAFHGTTPRRVKSIRETGFRKGSYFTLNPSYARHWGISIMKVKLPLDAIDFVGPDIVAIRPIGYDELI